MLVILLVEMNMRQLLIKHSVIVFTLCSLVACAAPGEPRNTASLSDEPVSRDCISQSSIRDYQVLDDSNLIVTASVRRKYHVQLSRRAFGLRSTWKIAFRSPTGMICGGSSDLVFDDGMRSYEQIGVRSIRELSAEETDDLLVRFGKKEAETKQALATEEVDGAEVEELD